MKYKLENKGTFKVVSIRETITPNEKGIFVPNINQTTRENFCQYFKQLSERRVGEILYIAVKQWEELSDYYVGVEISEKFSNPLPNLLWNSRYQGRLGQFLNSPLFHTTLLMIHGINYLQSGFLITDMNLQKMLSFSEKKMIFTDMNFGFR